ncbi:MAG: EamA family transporter [Candidatus Omnitrophota bacterium]
MKSGLTVKIIIFLMLSDVLETLTHFFFKKGALSQGEVNIDSFLSAKGFIFGVFSSPYLWAGLLSVLLTFIIWSVVLSKIDLSVAVPIASLSYMLVPLTSALFLKERVSILRWSGVLFILAGVIFVSLSAKDKEATLS